MLRVANRQYKRRCKNTVDISQKSICGKEEMSGGRREGGMDVDTEEGRIDECEKLKEGSPMAR